MKITKTTILEIETDMVDEESNDLAFAEEISGYGYCSRPEAYMREVTNIYAKHNNIQD